MSITEVVNMVTAFAIATGPIAITLGVLGHALVASKWPWLQRIGKLLEGIGLDLKRVSEAFGEIKKKGPDDKDPPDPPNNQKPTGLTTAALALTLVSCSGDAKPDARDAYQALATACALERLLPPDARKPETVEICAQLAKVCTDPAADAGAGGEGAQ